MRRNPQPRSGAALVESVLWIPILITLFYGMVQLARISYTYYALHKVMANTAKSLATAPGLNFCIDDARITTLKQFALSGGTDQAVQLLPGLEPDMIQVRLEREDPDNGDLVECDCSSSGCDISAGGVDPSYIVVSIPDGFPLVINFPTLSLDPIPLRSQVRMPVTGGG
jgi:hypothetical protein